MTRFYSPLRYPGGKGKTANFFKLIIRENNLFDGLYIEPYAGGASIALELLLNEYVAEIVINDIDRSIYAFWYCVLNHTEKLCDLISKTKLNLKNWQEHKEVQKNKRKAHLLELGFSTFFLNRVNRSGIINGGIIGGKSQDGSWRMDARFNREDLINRISNIANYKNRIKLYNSDACELVKSNRLSILPRKTIFYFDPPYYVKGKNLYVNYYEPEDHRKVSQVIKCIKQKWVVSYDNQPEIRKIYKSYRKKEYSLQYSVSKPGLGSEIMFFSNNLIVPSVETPLA